MIEGNHGKFWLAETTLHMKQEAATSAAPTSVCVGAGRATTPAEMTHWLSRGV